MTLSLCVVCRILCLLLLSASSASRRRLSLDICVLPHRVVCLGGVVVVCVLAVCFICFMSFVSLRLVVVVGVLCGGDVHMFRLFLDFVVALYFHAFVGTV